MADHPARSQDRLSPITLYQALASRPPLVEVHEVCNYVRSGFGARHPSPQLQVKTTIGA